MMRTSTNPYEAPCGLGGTTAHDGEEEGFPKISAEQLRNIALYQKGMIVGLLTFVRAVAATWYLPHQSPVLPLVTLLGGSLVWLTSAALLAFGLCNASSAAALAFLLVGSPFAWMITLWLNHRATKTLRSHGIRVGLFGARISQTW